ncbi:Stk1 family PASTA domain-containing Ser/Thr kinase [Clostridium sp. D2Q-14]|uniref:Stk1 family PASTA domain-containing Ser/Thr kinase n=1 Tax=Anaeromonas gelatinilytica TaxID=2683194 RepID=UPI00193B4D7E|nr:Stk1 family PASTA domain-containing Ser/Thr kinase [Anaeromonas gelatinilytica]MBS4536106.1 Stk1 family PASTA domain-containing Ser/Thr kinase [Anaeromonas gelatinilytica]
MIGKTLGNRYEIIEKIGGGGMALVYKAKCNLLNRYVAIKVLRKEFVNDEEFIEKFNRESQSAASLSHPNIVNIYDVGVEDNIYYIVMEYINGITLKQHIKNKGKLSPLEMLKISINIAKAINNAHKNNIIHRDIKPHNIMITEEGQIKVTDFGIARAVTSSTITQTNSMMGSVHYSSPEQAKGRYTDVKSDIYSLGIVMYEMITGKLPFNGESPISVALMHIQDELKSPRELDDSIPLNIDKIIRKATEKEKSLRYENVEELLKDLELAKNNLDEDVIIMNNFEDSPTQVMPIIDNNNVKDEEKKEPSLERKKPKKKKKPQKKKSKKWTAILAILLALLVTAGAVGGFLILQKNSSDDEVEVPNFVGDTLKEAEAKAEELGLEILVVEEKFSEEYDEGLIMSQNKEEGRTVVVGNVIEVVVSKGIELVKIPKIIGQYYNNAKILLNDVDLEEGEVTEEFSDLPVNIVIRQSPEAGEEIAKGSKVNYVISKGPEVKLTTVPTLIGSNVDSAKNSLSAYNLKLGEIEYEYNNEVPEGIIFKQSHASGEEIEEGKSVNISISKGSEPKSDPKPDPKPVTKSFKFTLPESDEDRDVQVQIYKEQNGKRELVYEDTHNTSEGETPSISITGQGTMIITAYYDGEKASSKEVEF